MACKLSLNIKEEFKTNNLIDKDNNILNPTKLNKVIDNIKALSDFKYGFKLPEDTFKIENINTTKSKLIINERYLNAIADDVELGLKYNRLEKDINTSISNQNYKVDKTLKERLFNNKNNENLSNILEKISKSDHSLAPLAKKLFDNLKVDIKVNLGSEVTQKNNNLYSGKYDSFENKIEIVKDSFFKQGKAESIIIHEALHYFTHSILGSVKSDAEGNIIDSSAEVKDFRKLFDYAVENLPNSYALSNLDEFVVALYTDSKFINQLKEIKPLKSANKYKNLFQELLDYLKGILNISKDQESLFDQAFNLSTNILKEGFKTQQDTVESYKDFLERNKDFKHNEETFYMYSMATLANRKNHKLNESSSETSFFSKKPESSIEEETKIEENKRKFEEKETSLKTADENLSANLKKAEQSLKERIDSLIKSSEFSKNKNKTKSEYLKKRAKELKEVLKKVEKYRETNKVTAALLFAEEAKNNLEYLDKQLNKLNTNDINDLEFVLTFYENYIKSFSSIPRMKELLNNYKAHPDESIKDFNNSKVDETLLILKEVESRYIDVKNNFKKYQFSYISKKLENIKYFPIIETKHIERLTKEHEDNNIKENIDDWILDKMQNRDKALIQKDLKERINSLLNDPADDISGSAILLGNGIKSSSELVRVFQQRLAEMKRELIDTDMKEDQKIKNLFNKISKEKNSKNPLKITENLIEFAKDGTPYLKSDYKLELLEGSKRMSAIRYKILDLEQNSKEYKKLEKEYNTLKDKYFEKGDDNYKVLDKYKNSYSNLSKTEKEILDYFKSKNDEGNNNIYGRKSLNKYIYKNKNIVFYELPKIYKSGLERSLNGNPLREIKEGYKNLSTVRPDDVGYINQEYDAEGYEINKIPLHYRDGQGSNKMNSKDISLDLFTSYRLEAKNLNRYKLKSQLELEFSSFIDVASYKPIYLKSGSQRHQNPTTKQFEYSNDSINSNMYKALNNMFEQQFYDILNKNGVKLGKLDANKLVGAFNGVTAFLSLTFNLGQGVANITNTKTQILLESFIKGDLITSKGIKNAEKLYGKYLTETLADATRPINKSLVNQINEYFDLEGNLMGEKANFLTTTLARKGLTKESLQVFQTSGEHWIQSIIILSVLDGIKVRDKDQNYINKDGKKVATEKEAASLLEMFSQDENKQLVISDKFTYTKFNKLTEFKKGGNTKIKMAIDNKLFDIVGNYKQDMRPEFYRHWYGKLFGMFRKYFYDSFNRRFSQVGTAFTDKGDLRENQKKYNNALQAYEEGTYTSLLRFITTAIRHQEYGLTALKGHWKYLSPHEKANITQAAGEISLTMAILPLLAYVLSAGFDDDDTPLLGFALYQIRRLESELSQFYNPLELFKILKSPIPSARLFKDVGDTIGILLNPFQLLNQDGSIDSDNIDKGWNNVLKKTPLAKEFLKDYHNLYNLQDSTFGSF